MKRKIKQSMKHRRTIKMKLNCIMIGSMLFVFSILIITMLYVTNQKMNIVCIQNVAKLVDNTSSILQTEISRYQDVTRMFANDERLSAKDISWNEKMELLRGYLERNAEEYGLLSIGYIDMNGTMEVTNGYYGNISDQHYFSELMNGISYVSGFISDASIGKKSIFFGEPIRTAEGTIVGGLTCSVELNFLSEVVKKIEFMGSGEAFILDTYGNYIAAKDFSLVEKNVNLIKDSELYDEPNAIVPIHKDMIEGKRAIDYYKNNKQKHMVIYQPMDNSTGWSIGFDIANKDISRDLLRVLRRLTILGGVCMLLFAGVISCVTEFLSRRLKLIQEKLNQFSTGDFCIDICEKDLKRQDEMGDVYRALDISARNISQTISIVKDKIAVLDTVTMELNKVSDVMNVNSDIINSSMTEAANGNSNQANSILEISKNMDDLGTNINLVTESVESIVDVARTADQSMTSSAHVLKELGDSLEEFSTTFESFNRNVTEMTEHIGEIDAITGTIQDITSQTNLLALNAAIESARAGEVGKGFAVVAEEIRNLAEACERSVQNIGRIIERILASGIQLKASSEEMNQKMQGQQKNVESTLVEYSEILKSISGILPMTEAISKASIQNRIQKDEMTMQISTFTSVSEELAATTEEVAATTDEFTKTIYSIENVSKDILSSVEELKEHMEQFKTYENVTVREEEESFEM